MQNLERDTALRIISSKANIAEPGIYKVKCTNVTPYVRERANGATQIAIANFNAKTLYHESVAATLFAQGDYDQAANQGLSLSILEGQFLPIKGQHVEIVVEEVTTSNGVTGLFVQSCTPMPSQTPTKRSSDAFLKLAEGNDMESASVLAEEPKALASEVEVPFKQ